MSTDTIPVIDTEKLNRTTNGDPKLQVEVLALFVAEVERLLAQVEDAEDPQLRGDRLRALAALARNTGAAKLAHEARTLETEISADLSDLSELKAVVSQTTAYVRQFGA